MGRRAEDEVQYSRRTLGPLFVLCQDLGDELLGGETLLLRGDDRLEVSALVVLEEEQVDSHFESGEVGKVKKEREKEREEVLRSPGASEVRDEREVEERELLRRSLR